MLYMDTKIFWRLLYNKESNIAGHVLDDKNLCNTNVLDKKVEHTYSFKV